jgi:hypothetical protein
VAVRAERIGGCRDDCGGKFLHGGKRAGLNAPALNQPRLPRVVLPRNLLMEYRVRSSAAHPGLDQINFSDRF